MVVVQGIRSRKGKSVALPVNVLHLTQIEANIDLKNRGAKVLEGRLQENKDVGGFCDNSWQRSVA